MGEGGHEEPHAQRTACPRTVTPPDGPPRRLRTSRPSSGLVVPGPPAAPRPGLLRRRRVRAHTLVPSPPHGDVGEPRLFVDGETSLAHTLRGRTKDVGRASRPPAASPVKPRARHAASGATAEARGSAGTATTCRRGDCGSSGDRASAVPSLPATSGPGEADAWPACSSLRCKADSEDMPPTHGRPHTRPGPCPPRAEPRARLHPHLHGSPSAGDRHSCWGPTRPACSPC